MSNNTKQGNTKESQEWDKTKIAVAVITAVATVLTVVGSIAIAFMTNNAQIEQQRFEEAREVKRTYYNQFIEAYTNKLQLWLSALVSKAQDVVEVSNLLDKLEYIIAS